MADSAGMQRITRTGFEIRPADGGPPLRGDLRVAEGRRPRSAVIIVHGFKGFRRYGAWPALARALALRGHAAVTFDFSHNGIDEQGEFTRLDLFRENTHTRELAELRLVVDALCSGALGGRAIRRVGLLGHSRGGSAAILSTAEDGRIGALVTLAAVAAIGTRWSAGQVDAWRRGEDVLVENARTHQQMPIGPGYWVDLRQNQARLDVLAAAARVRVPWLVVHGEADASVPVDDAHRLFEAAGENAELMLVADADHGLGARHPYPGPTDTLRTVAEAALGWFDTHLS